MNSAQLDFFPAEVSSVEECDDFDDSRCCDLAKRVPCVCRVSWKCPTHGTACVGSHD